MSIAGEIVNAGLDIAEGGVKTAVTIVDGIQNTAFDAVGGVVKIGDQTADSLIAEAAEQIAAGFDKLRAVVAAADKTVEEATK